MNKKTLVVILGNLTAFGPFITDFYLPCLPELTSYFSASPSLVQLSLTTGMLGLAAGQLVIGPVTDKYGRKNPLLWCLLVFILSTIGCMFSTDISLFIVFRLIQGLSGASGLVISKVIIADTFTAGDLARYFAILAAVQGAAPIVAPIIGGVAFSLTSWQGTFGVLGVWGIGLICVCRKLKETLPQSERLQIPIWKTFTCYTAVIGNYRYLVMNLLQSFSSAALLAYISASPFIFQNHFGMTALEYSVYFSCNAVGLVFGSSIVMKIKDLKKAIQRSVSVLFTMCILIALALLQEWHFFLFELFLIIMLFCVGMLTPLAITLALNAVTEYKGVAAALLGAIPFFFGGIVAPLTGIGDITHSMSVLIIFCSAACVCLFILSQKWDYTQPIPRHRGQ